MYVEVGNADALEGYRDPTSDDPDAVRYRTLPGQRITTLTFPSEFSLSDAFSTATTALTYHMAAGAKPAWIESDSAGLLALLEEHFGIVPSKNTRPKTWGKDTGANLIAAPTTTGEDA